MANANFGPEPISEPPSLQEQCHGLVLQHALETLEAETKETEQMVEALTDVSQSKPLAPVYKAYMGCMPTMVMDKVALQISQKVAQKVKVDCTKFKDFMSALHTQRFVNEFEQKETRHAMVHNLMANELNVALRTLVAFDLEKISQIDLSALKNLVWSKHDMFKLPLVNEEQKSETTENVFRLCLKFFLSRVRYVKHLNVSAGKYYKNMKASSYVSPCLVTDEHLQIIGTHCQKIKYFDISNNSLVTIKGLNFLVPDSDSETGLPDLKHFYVFDCILHHKDLARIAVKFPNLRQLGFKEVGRMIKYIYDQSVIDQKPFPALELTHLNNIGDTGKNLMPDGLRLRKPTVKAIQAINPKVQNIKCRVLDGDVSHLNILENLKTVELVYVLGKQSSSPGPQTESFLVTRGQNLTSLALICSTINFRIVEIIGQNCVNLNQLWLRCNNFNPLQDQLFDTQHDFFKNLKVLYFRVGVGNLSVVNIGEVILPYLVRNAQKLVKLSLAVRNEIVNDVFMTNLISSNELRMLEKLMILLPGKNDSSGSVNLGLAFYEFVIQFCPNLQQLGNLRVWSIPLDALRLLPTPRKLEIVNKIMFFY